VYVRASQQLLCGIGVPQRIQGACSATDRLQQTTFTHELAEHAVEGARGNTHSIAEQQQLRPAQHTFKIPCSNVPLRLARRIAADEGVVLNNTQLLSAIASNTDSFRGVTYSFLLLARRTARQSASAASIATTTIQQTATKKQ